MQDGPRTRNCRLAVRTAGNCGSPVGAAVACGRSGVSFYVRASPYLQVETHLQSVTYQCPRYPRRRILSASRAGKGTRPTPPNQDSGRANPWLKWEMEKEKIQSQILWTELLANWLRFLESAVILGCCHSDSPWFKVQVKHPPSTDGFKKRFSLRNLIFEIFLRSHPD